MISRPHATGALLALVAGCAFTQAAQNTKDEFWPEGDIYINYGLRIRSVVIDSFNQDRETKDRQGTFSYLLDFATNPVFRRELRGHEDVFRQRLLSFRAGYQYTTSFVNSDPSSVKSIIAESTWRAPLPGKFVISDRNRGELRFTSGEPFSMRYRQRIWIERDLKLGPVVFTPFVFDEIYYDISKSAWVPNQYAAGLQIPLGMHLVLEPSCLSRSDRLATPQYVNAIHLRFDFYF